eukprot:1153372-Pelagomonas_calceolata.AAC.5
MGDRGGQSIIRAMIKIITKPCNSHTGPQLIIQKVLESAIFTDFLYKSQAGVDAEGWPGQFTAFDHHTLANCP